MMGMATLGEELIHHGHNVTFCVAQIEAKYLALGKEICSRTGMVFLNTSPSLELIVRTRLKANFLTYIWRNNKNKGCSAFHVETLYNIKTSC